MIHVMNISVHTHQDDFIAQFISVGDTLTMMMFIVHFISVGVHSPWWCLLYMLSV